MFSFSEIHPTLRSEILGLLVNTLTADGKSSCHNAENFLEPFEMQSCKK